jgi:hypothetical protein
MSVDGFAVKSTIAQMGSVAKTQVKSQQTHSSTDAQAKQLDKKDNRLEKVKKTEDAQKSQVDPDKKKHGRKQKSRTQEEDDVLNGTLEPQDEDDTESHDGLGTMLDLKA